MRRPRAIFRFEDPRPNPLPFDTCPRGDPGEGEQSLDTFSRDGAQMKSVASRDNPAYKAMARLVSSGSERPKGGVSILDGPHLPAPLPPSPPHPPPAIANPAA